MIYRPLRAIVMVSKELSAVRANNFECSMRASGVVDVLLTSNIREGHVLDLGPAVWH